jgi:hypothetical protein
LSRLLPLLLCACGGLSEDPGLRDALRVAGAQFVEGPLPPAGAGPEIVQASLSRPRVPRGDTELQLFGSLDLATTSVAVGLEGDVGYWLVRAGLADPTVPGVLTLSGALSISPDAPLGAATVQLEAITAGVVGPRLALPLEIVERDLPKGVLVISLRWDTASDLDLHVIDAHGVEIWARHPNSWTPAPGTPSAPDAWKTGGRLDADSNAQCVIDGRAAENVSWSVAPPAGHYLVRVDTPSLCQASAARWTVDAVLDGASLGQATGVSTPASTRGAHDRGAGVTALELEVP